MSYNSLHTALESLVNSLLAVTMCSEINIVMSPNFQIENNRIISAEYRVECLKEHPKVQTDVLVTFDPPTEREDGSVLRPEEITGYEIHFIDGCVTGVTLTEEGRSREKAISCYGE